jgi:hypothetical protein
MKQAYHGVVDGVVKFDSSGHKLQLTPAQAGEDTIIPLAITSLPTAGRYRFSFKGEQSVSLAFDASVIDMATAIQELHTAKNYPGGALAVTCQTQMDAVGGGYTYVNFTNREVPEQVYVVSEGLVDVSADAVGVNTIKDLESGVSTRRPGKDGFTSGTYDIDCYALIYTDHHSKDGKISTETL